MAFAKKPKRKFTDWLRSLAYEDVRLEDGQFSLANENPQQQLRFRNRRRLAVAALASLALVILLWVLASAFLPKVKLGNTLYTARQSTASLQNTISQKADNYRLTIIYPDGGHKNFSLSDMGLRVDLPATIKHMRQRQNQFSSKVEWWRPAIVYLTLIRNDSQLDNFIAQQATITVQPARDATIKIQNGQVTLTDSTPGKHYGLRQPVAALTASAGNLQSQPLMLQSLATQPAISAQQLSLYQAKLQKILQQKISFVIGGQPTQATPADIANWLELTAKPASRSLDIDINSGKVLAYINQITAGYIHPPKAQVDVNNSDGSTTTLVSGVNGTEIANQSAVASDVAQKLLAGTAVQESLDVRYSAYKTITAQDYDKWIEVDLTNKRLYAYEHSDLIKTFLVSAGAPATPTVTGQYAIYAKYPQQDMRGRNVDGSSYFQPNVPWVNYFYADYAIHGNYWRPLSYFGAINSSHGCVGVVDNDAAWIYDWAPIGTHIIIHT